MKYFIALLMIIPVLSKAQKDLDLADQYFEMQDYAKAAELYAKSLKTPEQIAQYHTKYLSCLLKIGDNRQTEKYLRRALKDKPYSARYNVDYGRFLAATGETLKAKEHYKQFINSIKADVGALQIAATELAKVSEYEFAEQALLIAKPMAPTVVSYDLAALYQSWGKIEQAIDSYLFILEKDQSRTEYIQAQLFGYTADEAQAEILERKLLSAAQSSSDNLIYSEMLIWYYLQKRDFNAAFVQAKSYDRRRGLSGQKIMEIAEIALENKSYEDAKAILDFLVDKYKHSHVYPQARQLLIQTKEAIIESKYPVDNKQLQSLIKDYRQLIRELGIGQPTAESVMGMARLLAFYMQQYDSAITILNQLISTRAVPMNTISKAKLLLGDIYLLMGDTGEAGLTYMQVEAVEKDKDLGHLAKLKDAKLSYYEGQFELAKATLNVLKLATSREISNDALELAHIIQVNYDMDTTEEAMREYARIELLIFQNQLQKALEAYQTMLEKFKGHSLTDDVLWNMSKLYLKMGDISRGVQCLETIIEEYPTETWGDDAIFTLAVVMEEKIGDKVKAMSLYEKQLSDFPGSVYNVEARKRYRRLRGDKIK